MKYYETLNVPRDASPEQIRSTYRILVQLFHPDRLQQVNPTVRQYAEEQLKRINEAYAVLSDPEQRARYDAATTRAGPSHRDNGYWGEPDPATRSRRRAHRERTREDEAAYEEWARREAEREARAEAARAAREQAEAERRRRQAEEQARRAAEAQYPRTRVQGDEMILTFAPGLWTTLVRVPSGEFPMGSNPATDPQARKDELPQHRVYLSEYYIGKYPVTNEQYAAFLESAQRSSPAALPAGKATHPVVNVSWEDALAFCRWLAAATGRPFRLPTEAEWEKAARGFEARLYPWGDGWDASRLNGDGSQGDTTPVGRHSPESDSPYGIADMAGNVWEWCMDWYASSIYRRRGSTMPGDPPGPTDGEGCVVRGGAFDTSPRSARCAHRNWFYPHNRRDNVGFRLVVGTAP